MLTLNVKRHVTGFSLELELHIKPAFTALFGPSGAGKTTLLNLIAGLLSPSEGEIRLAGRILFSKLKRIDLPPRRRNVGYIFQEARLFPHLTVENNLAEFQTRSR